MRTFYWHEKKNLDLSRFFLIIGVTRLELAASTTPTDVGLSSRALCVLSCRFRSKTLAIAAFFVHCFRVFRVCLW